MIGRQSKTISKISLAKVRLGKVEPHNRSGGGTKLELDRLLPNQFHSGLGMTVTLTLEIVVAAEQCPLRPDNCCFDDRRV